MPRSCPAAFLLVLASTTVYITTVTARPKATDIWSFSVDEGPAPPPNEGPPLSAHASRNKSLLKYQITAIVGAYLLCVCFSLALIIFVGRRLRQRALSNRSLDMEMVKPAVKTNQAAIGVDPSPISPIKKWSPSSPTNSNQYPPPQYEKSGGTTAWVSPTKTHHRSELSQGSSVGTFDESVIASDKERNQREMEMLYAAVMDHDAKKSNKNSPEWQQDTSPVSPMKSPRQYPPEFHHLRDVSNGQSQQQHTTYQDDRSNTTSRNSTNPFRTPLSFFTPAHSRAGSAASTKSRPRRISIRDLPISPPMGSPDLAEAAEYAEDRPLSPRLYAPGPPPPTPGKKQAIVSVSPVEKNELKARKPSNRAAAPSPLPLRAAASSNSTLPFRSAYGSPPQSAPPTKTTVLEARQSAMANGARTGMPQTPYSPYMPFTPLTPVTPSRLVTKEDRKMEKKMKKNFALKPLREDDMVKSDEEVWGDGL